jgi:hypothetical protein
VAHRQIEKIVDPSSASLRFARDQPVAFGKTACMARSTSAREVPVTVRHNSSRRFTSASARTVAGPPSQRIDVEPVVARCATTRDSSIGSVSPSWPCHSFTREASGHESHGRVEPRDTTWVWACGGRCHPSARMLAAPTMSASQSCLISRSRLRSSPLVRSIDVPDAPTVSPEPEVTRFARTQNPAGHEYGFVGSSRATMPDSARYPAADFSATWRLMRHSIPESPRRRSGETILVSPRVRGKSSGHSRTA